MILIPLGGFTDYDNKERIFHDPDPDRALIETFREAVGDRVPVREIDADINAPEFSNATVDALLDLMRGQGEETAVARVQRPA